MPTKARYLKEIEARCNALATDLGKGDCVRGKRTITTDSNVRESNVVEVHSCIQAEEYRPLSNREVRNGWTRRPYDHYDPDRMCDECAACWHVNCARICLLNEIRRQAFAESR